MERQSFSNKFMKLASKRSPFCLGVDPTDELLKNWELDNNLGGLKKMCEIIIKAAGDNLAIVKPQSAYFERFGPEGLIVMQSLVKSFHEQGTLVLLDAKRGDIGSTSLAYAKAYLGPESPYKFDAMTAVAYLGFDALKPMLEHANEVGSAIFIVTKSSNKEGEVIQQAMVNHDSTIADHISQQIADFNRANSHEAIGPVGAVMGATLKNIKNTLVKLNGALMLAPGIGYQGASINDLLENYQGFTNRLIPSSSRAVLAAGPSVKLIRDAIEKNCEESFALFEKSSD